MIKAILAGISLTASLAVAACGGTESEPTPAAPPVVTQPPGTTSTQPPASTAATSPNQAPASSPAAVMPNEVGKGLQEAQDDLQAKGVAGFSVSHDLTGQTQFQVNDRAWQVCSQT